MIGARTVPARQRWAVLLSGVLAAPAAPLLATPVARAEPITLQLVQLNDVYEITPLPGGGGDLAQVAGLVRQLRRRQPNTLVLLAGDALSPSALGTAQVGGQRLDGRQMVAVLNALGLDAATFGNHEFDLTEPSFRARLKDSRFAWISSNVSGADGQPFPGVARDRLIELRGPAGARLRLGLLGITLSSNPAPYVRYGDPLATATAQAQGLRRRGADVVVALTHQALAADQQLADSGAPIDLILGGHEHENVLQLRLRTPASASIAADQPPSAGAPPGCRPAGVPIAKADANARTVVLHTLRFDPRSRCLAIRSDLLPIDGRWPIEPQVRREAERWQALGNAAFRRQGLQPERVVATSPVSLDGRSASVRNGPTALTQLLGQALRAAVPGSDLAILNSGAIRIDDVLPPGPIRELDVVRVLPFGGRLQRIGIQGQLLQRVLEAGLANRGNGGFLVLDGAERDGAGRWRIAGQPLNPERRYSAAIADFLLTGRETGLGFLTPTAPGLELLGDGGDLRQAVISWLAQGPWGQPLPPKSR
ncbi:bifunctional metallophosphatase/5'-nucleotidase [Vulcanococcus limneticus]|uniref:bifunctional metallophosphatase/5'-nucleotidase n=1 Tax=Vulcanococcus limneticus TaxID=2170428 RepID=UPI00398C0D64